jgi:hypothetical protein
VRRLLIVILLLAVFPLAGCWGLDSAPTTVGSSNTTTPAEASSTSGTGQTTTSAVQATTTTQTATTVATTTTSLVPSEVKWGATVALQGITVTVGAPVDDTAKLSTAERSLLKKGDKVMYMIVTIKNDGDKSYEYNSMAFELSDSEGFKYDSVGVFCSQPTLDAGKLLPGRTVKGAVPFEMPKKSHPSFLDFKPNIVGDIGATWGD